MSYRLYQLPESIDDPHRADWLRFLAANGIPANDTPMGARLTIHNDGTILVPQLVRQDDGRTVICRCACDDGPHAAKVDSTFTLASLPENFGLPEGRCVAPFGV